ncbi:MAG: cupin domain-containing protein [Dysgonamonadaceae bacterium]|jgi:quercetin dioxygenase-like cupin family protein|nr:cupin domain-containing protein [Dysgonamonadaceae bacterium]
MKSKDFILSEETVWEVTGAGLRRQILGYDGQIMLVKVEFQAGAVGVGHKHYHSQTTYVSSGVFEFYIEDKKQIIKAGDGVYVAPEAFHGLTCIESGIVIDVFSPVREDFLK